MNRRTASIVREVRKLRTALHVAQLSLARLTRHVIAVGANPGGNGRTHSQFSAKGRASLVLQGRYMGYMRQLKPRQKTRVRKIREAKGVRVAIARARELAR